MSQMNSLTTLIKRYATDPLFATNLKVATWLPVNLLLEHVYQGLS